MSCPQIFSKCIYHPLVYMCLNRLSIDYLECLSVPDHPVISSEPQWQTMKSQVIKIHVDYIVIEKTKGNIVLEKTVTMSAHYNFRYMKVATFDFPIGGDGKLVICQLNSCLPSARTVLICLNEDVNSNWNYHLGIILWWSSNKCLNSSFFGMGDLDKLTENLMRPLV